MRPLIVLYLGIILGLSINSIQAQTFCPISINVNAFQDHSCDFYAFDAQNRLVRDLTANDVLVTNGSTALQVTSVSCPATPTPQKLSVVLCLDVSGSMNQDNPKRIATVKTAASILLNMLDTTQNECAITSFDHLSYVNSDFTNNRSQLLAAVNSLQPQGATDYNNALLAAPTGAMQVATRGQYKRVVIMMTDGDGGGKLDSIVNFARLYNITVYTISYHLQAPQILYDIAQQTGGIMLGDLNYESISTGTQLNAAFRAALVHAQGIPPCSVHFWADRYCYSSWRYATLAVPSRGMPAIGLYYILPTIKIPFVYMYPASLTFGAVPPGTYVEKTIQLYSYYAPITIDGGSFSNAHFTVVNWGGTPPPFVIDSATSRFITVRYTSTDTTYQYGALQLQTNMCTWPYFGASAGYQSRYVPQKTLHVVNPVSPDNANSCYYTYHRWDGIAANDSVRVEWSFDDGKTWTMLVDNFAGNFEQWFRSAPRTGTNNKVRISHVKMQNDRFQTLKYGHAGQMRQFAINPQNQNQAVVCLNPDNNYLSTRKAYVINLQTGDTLATLTPSGNKVIQQVLWSADGNSILTVQNGTSGGQISFWSASTYQLQRSITDASGAFTSVAINPAGTRIAAGIMTLQNAVKVYDAATGSVLATMLYHTTFTNAVAYSADGSRIASVDQNGRCVVWNASSYARINSMDVTPTVMATSVNFNPAMIDVVAVSYVSGVTRLWSTLSAQEMRNFNGNIGAHFYTCFNSSGTRVISCGETGVGNSLYRGASVVWDAATGNSLFSLDGTGFLNQHNWRSYWAAYTPDGAHIVTANNFGGINTWSSSGAHEKQFLVRNAARGAVVSGCYFNNDRNIATMGEDGSVVVHDVITRDSVRSFWDLGANSSKINQVRVSPSGSFMAALSADNTMALWNVQTGQLITRITNAGYGPAFSRNSQYVAVVMDSIVRVYVTSTGALYKTYTLANFISGRDLCYNYDDSRLLITGASSASTMSVVSVNTNTWSESNRYTDTYYIGSECSKISYAPGSRYTTVFHTSTSRSYILDSNLQLVNTINDNVQCITPHSGYALGQVISSGHVRSWRTADKAVMTSTNIHQGYQVSQVAVSENSSRALICSHDGNAWMWDFASTPIQSDTSATPFVIGTSILKKVDTVNFGKVLNNGSKDSVINQIISNIGTSWDYIYSVSISGYNKDEFRIVKKNTGLYLYPGQSLTYELGFIPRTKVVGIKEVKMTVVTLCDTLVFVLVGESVNPPTNNLIEQIDFGKVEITTRKDTTVTTTIKNVTNQPLNITNTRILGPDTVQFSIVSGGGSFVLPPNETRTVTLRFAPTRISLTSARLAFFHAFLGSPATILLTGEGIGIPRVTASSAEVSMRSIICSDFTPVDTVLRINNIGTGVLSLDSARFFGVDSTSFTVLNTLPDTIAAGSWKNIRIRFLPKSYGQRTATLRLYTGAQNVNNGIVDCTVRGFRDTVILSFAQQNLDLLNVRPYTSVDAFITLTNRGTVPMTLPVPVQLGKFTIMSISPNPIPSGVTARVYVNFANGDTSMVYDTLYTVRDSCGGLSSIRLRAFTQSPKATMYFNTSVDMATTPCAAYADTTLIITNVGMLPLLITDLRLIGDTLGFYRILHSPPAKIEPNEMDSVVLRYQPTSMQSEQAALQFTSNAQNSTAGVTTVPLNGKWIQTSFVLDTSSLGFIGVVPNTPDTLLTGVTNSGNAPISWTLPMTKGRFSIIDATPNPTLPGAHSTLRVRFSGGTSAQVFDDTIQVSDQCKKIQPLALHAEVQTTLPRLSMQSTPKYDIACKMVLDTFFVISNTGLDTLRIDSVSIISTAQLTANCTSTLPRRILPAKNDTIRIHLDVSANGSASAVLNPTLHIRSNSDKDSVFERSFTINVLKSNMSFNPKLVSFPKLRPNRQNTQQIWLKNTGTLVLRVSVPLRKGRFSIDSVSRNPIAPGDSVVAYVRFAGDTVGMYSDALVLTDSCGSTHDLPLTVEVAPVVPAHLQAVSSVAMFEQCYTAQDTTVLLSNTGGEELEISRIYLRGANADEFSIENDTALTLSPEQTHLVLVRHHSHGILGLRTCELVVVSNSDSLKDVEHVTQINLKKDSVDISFDLSELFFGVVQKNTVVVDSIGLTNRGSLAQVVATPIKGQFFTIDSIVPQPIAPGTTSKVYAHFNVPDSVGRISETLHFANPCARQVDVTLSGQLRGALELSLADTTVQIGDIFRMPLSVNDARIARLAGVDSVTVTLQWNTTMMALLSVPRGQLLSNIEDGPKRIIVLRAPFSSGTNQIAELEFQAALGNDTTATIEFVQWKLSNGAADLKTVNGHVAVTGQCRDGGTRLMDRANPTALRALYPNPSDGNLSIDLTTPERAPLSLTLYDAMGKAVRVLYQGMPPSEEWQFKVALADIPAGVYQVILRTASEMKTRRVEIVR